MSSLFDLVRIFSPGSLSRLWKASPQDTGVFVVGYNQNTPSKLVKFNLAESDYLTVENEAEWLGLKLKNLPATRLVKVNTGGDFLSDGDIVQAIRTSDLSNPSNWSLCTPVGTQQILVRAGTKAELDAADPALLPAEPALETDTGNFRMGSARFAPIHTKVHTGLPLTVSDSSGFDISLPAGTYAMEYLLYGGISLAAADSLDLNGGSGYGAFVQHSSIDLEINGVYGGRISSVPGDVAAGLYDLIKYTFVIVLAEDTTLSLKYSATPVDGPTALNAGSYIKATRIG